MAFKTIFISLIYYDYNMFNLRIPKYFKKFLSFKYFKNQYFIYL